MITLTRLSGSVFLLNADLIERVDSTPDTVITLVDGKKYVVAETLDRVFDAVVAYRGEIVAAGARREAEHLPSASRPGPRLAAVTEHPAGRAGASEASGEARRTRGEG
jgi:flagellar protein FlbD